MGQKMCFMITKTIIKSFFFLYISNKLFSLPAEIFCREHSPSSNSLSAILLFPLITWSKRRQDYRWKASINPQVRVWCEGVSNTQLLQSFSDQVFTLRCVWEQVVVLFPTSMSKHSRIVALQCRKERGMYLPSPSLFTKSSGDQPEEA